MTKKTTLILMLFCAFISTSMAQTILTEGFESGTFPPAGWAVFRGTNDLGTAQDWIQNTPPNTGSYCAYSRYENVTGGTAEDWLVTSQIDLTSATNSELLFHSRQTYGTNYGSNYEVKVSTSSQTNHADFTTVAAYDETTVGTNSAYELKTVDLSAYDGMTIYIAFVHLNDDGDNWLIDDIEVRSPLTLDAKLEDVTLNRYSLTSVDNNLSMNITNNGSSTITALDVAWNDGTNNYSENFTVNITPGQTQAINHSTPVNYASVDERDITVTIENVNGNTDGDSSNNSLTTKFNTISQSGTKAVLIEEATGTWCGWCPRGAVGLEYMTTTYPNTVVGVAVHNGDPMVVTEYDSAIGSLIAGYPSSVIDRRFNNEDPSQSNLESVYNQINSEIVPANLNANATLSGNDLTITTEATFYSNFNSADFRFAVIMTENGVTGTTAGYNQANYYSGGSNGAMGGYENMSDPVPAANMVYDHVGRALLGGFNGEANSVPASITNGQTVQYNFNYTIPATSNQDNMYIVVVLIDNSNGSIVNSFQKSVNESLSTTDFELASAVKIYPNPANDRFNVSFEASNANYDITVTDMLGRTVLSENYKNLSGNQNIEISTDQFSTGQYIVTIATGNASYSKHLVVNK